MVEKARRRRVDEQPRAGDERAWEVFVREGERDPLRHVGTVTAPDADVAHERASRLFAWYAEEVWCCPADAVARYEAADDAEVDEAADDVEVDQPATAGDGSEPRTHEL